MSDTPRLTVAIPLFHGLRWLDNVAENIRRIPHDTRIILSDETGSDDAAAQLARRFAGRPDIIVRLRQGQPGWRAHCNALIDECQSELFSFLPQDDLIEPGYYERLIDALDRTPSAGIAFGSLYFEGDGFPTPARQPSLPFETAQHPPWEEAVRLEWHWNLGIAFRGVIRSRCLRPIPPAPDDRFADKLWILGIALGAHLIEDPEAVYRKQIHAQNTFTGWAPYPYLEWIALLAREIRTTLDEESTEQALACLLEIYEERLLATYAGWRSHGIC